MAHGDENLLKFTPYMTRYFFILSAFSLLVSCKGKVAEKTAPEVPEPTMAQQQWQQLESKDGSKPVQRHEAAFVRVGAKFYLMGGRDIRPVSIYDTETGSWSQGAEPPLELHHFQPLVFEGKIYVIAALTGGWPNETPTSHVYIYDPSADAWSQGDEIPEDRRRGASGVVVQDHMVYIACGIKNGHIGDHKKWMDRYNLRTGKWEVLSDAPRPRDHFQAIVVDGKIYATAGRNTGIDPDDPFGGTLTTTDVYDIATNSWETVSNPIPTPRAGNAALLFNGELVVIGGESSSQEKAHAEVEALNLTTNEWYALPSLLQGRHGTGVVVWDNAMVVASGCGNRGGEPELQTMERYLP